MPAFLAEARKFTVTIIGAAGVILPLVLGASGAWVHYFQSAVAVLTALGVYVVPNASSSAPVASASAKFGADGLPKSI